MIQISPIQRVALLSVHTSPLAPLGQKKTGGMNVYVRDFSRELARRGLKVDIFTRAINPNGPQVLHNLGRGCRVIQLPAGPVRPIPNDKIGYHLNEFTARVHNFTRTQNIRYDLIHGHYWLSGVVAGKLRQIWGPTPVVQMYHTLGHLKNQIALDESQRAAPVRLIGESYAANVADRLVAATPAEKLQLIELYGVDPQKITVVSPGVDLERFNPVAPEIAKRRLGLPPEQRLVLFVGRVEPLKGIDTILQAVSRLRQQQPAALENVRVGIIGGNPDDPDEEMTRLQQMHQTLALPGSVTFMGAKDQSLLPTYYSAADLVVMPSHYESFGMVALEAMAMGVPVIASRVGGLAHLVKDGFTGFLIPPRNPEALAEKLHTLLVDEPHRRRLAAQARAYAGEYDWPNIVDRIEEVYAALVEQYVLV